MFSELKIAKSAGFEKHLNKYNVIHINMVNFLSESKDMNELIDFVSDTADKGQELSWLFEKLLGRGFAYAL